MLRRGRHAPEMLALTFGCAYLSRDEQRGNLLLMLSASVELEMLFHLIIFLLFFFKKKNIYLFFIFQCLEPCKESWGIDRKRNCKEFCEVYCSLLRKMLHVLCDHMDSLV